eukprot:651750-Pyramimonas_sp.AAC.1
MEFYSQADPPIARADYNYAYLSRHIPLRSSSKLLKDGGASQHGAESTGALSVQQVQQTLAN